MSRCPEDAAGKGFAESKQILSRLGRGAAQYWPSAYTPPPRVWFRVQREGQWLSWESAKTISIEPLGGQGANPHSIEKEARNQGTQPRFPRGADF